MPPDAMRVVLVDDEPLVRSGIRDALASRADVTIVGEASDGVAAIEVVELVRPELLFLDVQMPGLDGFDVLSHLEPAHRPAVVFVTAYDQYALRAFEAHALDYLLKPFDCDRLMASVDRVRTWLVGANRPPAHLDTLIAERQLKRARDRFVVKHSGQLRLIWATDTCWIEASGNYVWLHTREGSFLLREAITHLAHCLDQDRFMRVHRSAIVALPEVIAMQRMPSGDYELSLRNGSRVPMSRTHKADFAKRWRG